MKTIPRPALQLGEIVLRTSRYDTLRSWYAVLLGCAPYFERRSASAGAAPLSELQRASDSTLCFFRLHHDHPFVQVLAIFDVPGTRAAASGDPGLHHMQLRVAGVDGLSRLFLELRLSGVLPFRCVDHGPGISYYYRDPDGNVVELCATNFERSQDYLDCLASPAFQADPSGRAVDPDEIAARGTTHSAHCRG